ncbi:MAG: pyridoxal phosphate-dependent aminotransferase, partial [Eubacterium sp.]
GTGAVRHAVCNYTEFSDKILIPDWYWAPYTTIADENRRGAVTFELFSEGGTFNMTSYKNEFLKLLKEQNRVLSILNTPAHNPTGYSVSMDEWKELVAFYTETAKAYPESRIIILCDIAYIDFAGKGDDARAFMPLLSNMPENVLPLYAYSASKGYTMYGLRNGAIICAAPTEAIADEFVAACSYSNRGTWSNGT